MKKIIVIIMCLLIAGIVPSALGLSTEDNIKYDVVYINKFSDVAIINNGEKNDVIEVIDQQQINNCGYGCPFFGNLWLAQGFTPSLDSLTRIELYLFKTGNPSSTITVSVRESLTGTDLTSISIDGNNIPPNGIWVNFDIPDISIVSGSMHYIVCRTPSGSVIDYYCCLFDVNNPYEGGETWGSLNSGATWSLIEYPGYPDPDGCFITYGLDETPNIPTISGQTNGAANTKYEYTFATTDPENHDVYYYIEWGDGENSEWFGPYKSGEEIKVNHTWSDKGSYLIKCKAKDPYGAESDWKTLKVTMPRSEKYSIEQNQGRFAAQLGKRGNHRPIVYFNGSYHARDRYFIVNGTIQKEIHLGRFKGLFKGNHFIIRASIRDRVLTILGRCSFNEEHHHFRGVWVGRGIPIRGWITGILHLRK